MADKEILRAMVRQHGVNTIINWLAEDQLTVDTSLSRGLTCLAGIPWPVYRVSVTKINEHEMPLFRDKDSNITA